MLLHRNGRWLLSVRGKDVAYAPGSIGMIGGHLEVNDLGPGVLEAAGRREVLEETGVDLGATRLRYLDSTAFTDEEDGVQISVTFVAAAPVGAEATVAAPDELAYVGWWALDELVGDPRCPDWLPPLIERAERALVT